MPALLLVVVFAQAVRHVGFKLAPQKRLLAGVTLAGGVGCEAQRALRELLGAVGTGPKTAVPALCYAGP